MEDSKTLIEALYSTRRIIGRTGKEFDGPKGISSLNNLKTIEQMMERYSPRKTLEVGLAFGGSATVFASTHKKNNPTGLCAHTAIDPLQTSHWDGCGRLRLEETQLMEFVEVIEERSSVALPRLMAEGRQYGMIYVDGSHLFEDAFIDAYYCMRLLETGGYLLFDDCSDPHVAKVIAFIDASVPGLERQAETNLKQTIARYLGKRQLTVYRRIGPVEREWTARFKRF